MSNLIQNVDFNIIRYANCWEDADILLQGLALNKGSRILSIASGGDNSFALLATEPEVIHAIDVSLSQLYLAELKRAAFQCLEYEELLCFLGIIKSDDKILLYHKLRNKLSGGAAAYWDGQKKVIENGLVYGGKFEKYFAAFRNKLLPWVHSRETVVQLLQSKTAGEQTLFFDTTWNTWRWKLLMTIFFSRYVMGKYGRDPEFMKHLDISVSQYIRQRAEQHLRSPLATANYFLHMIFTGSFGNTLPFYLRPENFDITRRNIHKLELHQVSAHEAVRENNYNAYNLSNVFEYMSLAEFKFLSRDWMNYIPVGSRLAYWNLMAYRIMSEIVPGSVAYDKTADELSLKDKGFFYSRFVLEERI